MPGEAFWVWLKEQVIALQKKKSTPWTNRRRQELLNSGEPALGSIASPSPGRLIPALTMQRECSSSTPIGDISK
jgi:hypothetical protein